jgi:hypothetical protein
MPFIDVVLAQPRIGLKKKGQKALPMRARGAKLMLQVLKRMISLAERIGLSPERNWDSLMYY